MATTPHIDTGEQKYGPTKHLIGLFRACPSDPTEEMEKRLNHMLNVFLEHQSKTNQNKSTEELAKKCCRLTRECYYQILEILLNREVKIKGIRGVSRILEEDSFQRQLVTCCLEICVRSAQIPCNFSTLLEIFKLPGHYFPKTIELVVYGLCFLHPLSKKLLQVETEILESLAWTSNSKLWEDIKTKGSVPTWEQLRPPTQLEHPPSRTDVPSDQPAEYGLRKDHLEKSLSPSMHHGSSSAMNKAVRNHSFYVFFHKFYVLMEKRLKVRCSELGISDDLKHKIWTCLEYTLVKHTSLMTNRDLDQLVFCAIYNTAKITQTKLDFEDVMNCFKYRSNPSKSMTQTKLTIDDVINCFMPQSNPSLSNSKDEPIPGRVEKTLPTKINDNGDHTHAILTPTTPSGVREGGDLIYFYRDYGTTTGKFANCFSPNSGGQTPPMSPYPQPQKQPSRSYRLPGYRNITVLLLDRKSIPAFRNKMTYFIKSSSPECLREINNMIKTGTSRRRPRQDLKFGKEEQEDGPPSKRFRSKGLSALDRRLRNVVDDRARVQKQKKVQPSPPEEPKDQ